MLRVLTLALNSSLPSSEVFVSHWLIVRQSADSLFLGNKCKEDKRYIKIKKGHRPMLKSWSMHAV